MVPHVSKLEPGKTVLIIQMSLRIPLILDEKREGEGLGEGARIMEGKAELGCSELRPSGLGVIAFTL